MNKSMIIAMSITAIATLMSSSAFAGANTPPGMFCLTGETEAAMSVGDDWPDANILDVNVTNGVDTDGLICVICSCPGEVVVIWGANTCSPMCEAVKQGAAKFLDERSGPIAVPALSVLGTVLLFMGILTGVLYRSRRSAS